MNDSLWIAIIASLPGIAALLLGILTLRQSSKKDQLSFLQSENKRLWERNQEMQDEIDELRELVAALQKQIRELGNVPVSTRRRRSNDE